MDRVAWWAMVHRISQARILEWVAISFCRGFPNPGIEPVSPALAGEFFTTESPGKPWFSVYVSSVDWALKVKLFGSHLISVHSIVGKIL